MVIIAESGSCEKDLRLVGGKELRKERWENLSLEVMGGRQTGRSSEERILQALYALFDLEAMKRFECGTDV